MIWETAATRVATNRFILKLKIKIHSSLPGLYPKTRFITQNIKFTKAKSQFISRFNQIFSSYCISSFGMFLTLTWYSAYMIRIFKSLPSYWNDAFVYIYVFTDLLNVCPLSSFPIKLHFSRSITCFRNDMFHFPPRNVFSTHFYNTWK